jgi:hypothetical protein
MTSFEQERVAECQTLLEDIRNFYEELNSKEKEFITGLDERLTKYGQSTYISDKQYSWLQGIHERVC